MFNGSNSPSLADIAAVTGNGRNNDGMWGGDGWWAIIIFAMIFGWGGFGNGWGGFGGNGQGFKGILLRRGQGGRTQQADEHGGGQKN